MCRPPYGARPTWCTSCRSTAYTPPLIPPAVTHDRSTNNATRSSLSNRGYVLAEVVHEHDVRVRLARLCIENPAAVRRDRHAISEIFLGIEDLTDLFGDEIEVPDGLWRISGYEIDASRNDGPLTSVKPTGIPRSTDSIRAG